MTRDDGVPNYQDRGAVMDSCCDGSPDSDGDGDAVRQCLRRSRVPDSDETVAHT